MVLAWPDVDLAAVFEGDEKRFSLCCFCSRITVEVLLCKIGGWGQQVDRRVGQQVGQQAWPPGGISVKPLS